jgi:hypothetical protein
VPDSETVCGLFWALSLMVNVPDFEPLVVGVNVTLAEIILDTRTKKDIQGPYAAQ